MRATLLVVLAWLVMMAAATADDRVALVIGNSAYAGVGVLPNPKDDAALIAQTLGNEGFKVTLVLDADHAAMLKALRRFGDVADQADWALVYYAGHGVEIGGTNYLLPTDVELRVDRDAQDEAIPLSRVLDTVANARKLRLVILDACRNNPFAATMKRSISVRAVERGLAPAEPSAGILVVYAAAAGDVAEDGGGEHSPFTTALAHRMQEPGLEVSRLFNVVTADVLDATGGRQRPYLYGSNPTREEFYFQPPAQPSAASAPASAALGETWGLMKASTDLPLLKSFLERVPEHDPLRAQVEARIAALTAGAATPALTLAPAPAPAPAQRTTPPAENPPRAARWRVRPNVSEGIQNVRSGPGKNYPLLFSIPAGSGGVVLGNCRRPVAGGGSFDWCVIQWRGQTGWASSNGFEADLSQR